MILDGLKAYAAMAAAGVLAAGLVTQTIRLNSEQGEHNDLKLEVAQAAERAATATLKQVTIDADKTAAHAKTTQENSDAFTISQPVRDAIARADAARHNRLLSAAETRSARYRAEAAAGAAACSNLADRLEAFDRQLVDGVGVVGGLRADLDRRDSEVKLLRATIDADRALLGD